MIKKFFSFNCNSVENTLKLQLLQLPYFITTITLKLQLQLPKNNFLLAVYLNNLSLVILGSVH